MKATIVYSIDATWSTLFKYWAKAKVDGHDEELLACGVSFDHARARVMEKLHGLEPNAVEIPAPEVVDI